MDDFLEKLSALSSLGSLIALLIQDVRNKLNFNVPPKYLRKARPLREPGVPFLGKVVEVLFWPIALLDI